MKKLFEWFSYLLIIFIPVSALLANILEFKFGISTQGAFWFVHWYEPAIVLFVLGVSIKKIAKRKFNKYDLILILFLISAISIFLNDYPLLRGIEGFRLSLLPLSMLYIAVNLDWEKNTKKRILITYMIVATLVATWGILERFLPPGYWSSWSLLPESLYFGYGDHKVVNFLQSASLLGGPNQFASFLLPAFFIGIHRAITEKNKRLLIVVVTAILFLAIVFSFSRSAAIGLITGLSVYPFFALKSKKIKFIWIFTIFTFLFGGLLFLNQPKYEDLITHGSSQIEHQESLRGSLDEIKNRIDKPLSLIVGKGLGSSGPLIVKYGDGLIPESWYLQLFFEIGILGLLVWLLIIGFILRDLLRINNPYLFVGMISVLVTSLFLHTWADNPALSYTLLLLAGLSLSKDEKI